MPYIEQGDLPALELKTSVTGGKLPFLVLGGGFSRLILSWNIRG